MWNRDASWYILWFLLPFNRSVRVADAYPQGVWIWTPQSPPLWHLAYFQIRVDCSLTSIRFNFAKLGITNICSDSTQKRLDHDLLLMRPAVVTNIYVVQPTYCLITMIWQIYISLNSIYHVDTSVQFFFLIDFVLFHNVSSHFQNKTT